MVLLINMANDNINWFQVSVMVDKPLFKWVKVFKNGLSKICGRQPLKKYA